MGRTSLTKRKISEWLQNGHHCWLAWSGNKVVGGLWIFFGHINLHTLSARVLSKNKDIFLTIILAIVDMLLFIPVTGVKVYIPYSTMV